MSLSNDNEQASSDENQKHSKWKVADTLTEEALQPLTKGVSSSFSDAGKVITTGLAAAALLGMGVTFGPAIAGAIALSVVQTPVGTAAGVAGVVGVMSWLDLNSGNRAIKKENLFRQQLMDLENQALEAGVSPEDIEVHVTSRHQRTDVPSQSTERERSVSLAALIRREQGDEALQNKASMTAKEFRRVSSSLERTPKASLEEIQTLKEAGLHELAKKEITEHSLTDIALHTGRGALKTLSAAYGFNEEAPVPAHLQVKHEDFKEEVKFLAEQAKEQGVPLDQVKVEFIGLDSFREAQKARQDARYYEVPLSKVVSGEVIPEKDAYFKIEKTHESIALEQISDMADRLQHRRAAKTASEKPVLQASTVEPKKTASM